MIYILLIVATLVFFGSLVGYQKLRGLGKNQVLEWLLWIGFAIWTLAFVLVGMSFLKANYPETTGAVAVAPIAIGAILFVLLNRKKLTAKGFTKDKP
jgi:hypothetical protein